MCIFDILTTYYFILRLYCFFVLCICHEDHYDNVKIDFEQLNKLSVNVHLHNIIIFIKTSRGVLVENQLSKVSKKYYRIFQYPVHVYL